MIREIVAVGIGGALGSMSRYLVSYVWLAEQSLLGFPAGTFTVNAGDAGRRNCVVAVERRILRRIHYLFHFFFRRGADA